MSRSSRRPLHVVPRFPLVIAVVMMLTGCGPQGRIWSDDQVIGGTRIRLAISLQPDEARAVSELVKRFEAETRTGASAELFTRFRDQSGVKVTVDLVKPGGMEDLLMKEGSNIQLFAQDNGALAGLVADGLVQDISDVPVDPGVIPAGGGAADGRQRFLPFRPNVRLTYANRSELQRAGVTPPGTVEEFEKAANKLKDADGRSRVTLSLSQEDGGAPTAVTISELVLSLGGDPKRLDDPRFVEAFAFLQRLFREGLLTRESLFGKHDTEPDYLLAGTAWLAQNWSVTSATLEKAGRLGDFEVDPGWQKQHVVGGDVLGIPTGVTGRERRAAVALARFLMTKEAQAFLVQKNAWPSIRDDAYDLVGRDSETIAAARQALKGGWYRPMEKYWDAVTHAMNEAVNRVVFSQEPVEAVLYELHTKVSRDNPDYARRD
ncbi:MAG: extracellular solute-binding protein [Actinobacteria bacterium]|nr:extracellular solute-binding protein [Actinomycetota bacterium]